jgi:hypothetical protein
MGPDKKEEVSIEASMATGATAENRYGIRQDRRRLQRDPITSVLRIFGLGSGSLDVDDDYVFEISKKALEHLAENRLPAHPDPNVALFFFKYLFFPHMSDREIRQKMEKAGALKEPKDMSTNENSARYELIVRKVLTPAFLGPDPLPLREIAGMLNQYEKETVSPVFTGPYRFISALRSYILYGKPYLLYQDFLLKRHCEGGGACFFIASTEVPMGEENVLVIRGEDFPYVQQKVIHVKLEDETIKDPFFVHALYPKARRRESSAELLDHIDEVLKDMRGGGSRRKTRRVGCKQKGTRKIRPRK